MLNNKKSFLTANEFAGAYITHNEQNQMGYEKSMKKTIKTDEINLLFKILTAIALKSGVLLAVHAIVIDFKRRRAEFF